MLNPDDRKALRLDRRNARLWRGAEAIALPPKAFALLVHLADHAGQLVTKEQLLASVWGGTFVGDDVLKVNVKQIRAVVGDDAKNPWLIETVHRRGYRLLEPIPEAVPAAVPADALVGDGVGEPVLVGRGEVFASLDEYWRLAHSGSRQVVFVTGEPGIGKSALVDWFARELRRDARAPRVGSGYCLEDYGADEAYLPVLEALEDLLRHDDDGAVALQLRRYAPTWLARFPWLVEPGHAAEQFGSGSGASREGMLRELATALELISGDRPLVLFLEDLHWSDPSTVAVLAHVAQRRHPARLLIVGTLRPVDLIVAAHPLREIQQTLRQRGHCADVPLRYLHRPEIDEFLARHLGSEAKGELVDFVHARTSGNPLFLHNFLDYLRGANLLEADGGQWRLAASARDDVVPEAIDAAIVRRLDRLEPAERSALEVASVAGTEFSAATVAAALEGDLVEVEDICERLARRGEILVSRGTAVLAGGAVSGRYEFQHALFQNVLYGRIPPARRMMWHRQVGAWLEANGAGSGELAFHFSRSGSDADARKAAAFSMQAANAAKAVFAYAEAIRHGEAALRHAASMTARDERVETELLVDLGDIRQRAGFVTEADRHFRAAVEAAARLAMPAVQARAAVGIGHGYQRIGVVDTELIESLEQALATLEPGDQPVKALALAHLDFALCSVPGSAARRAGLGSQALAMARCVGDIDTHACVLQYNRWAYGGPSTAVEWRDGIREIETLLPKVADAERELMLRYVLVTDLLDLGDVARAQVELDHMRDRAEETQIPWCLWIEARLRTAIALLQGRFAETEILIREGFARGERTDHPNLVQMAGAQSCLLAIERGALADAVAIVDVAIAQNPTVPTWSAVAACLAAELGDTSRTEKELEPFRRCGIEPLPQDTSWFLATGFLAVASCLQGDQALGAALYDSLLPYRNRCTGMGSSILSLGHVQRYLGLAAAAARLPAAEEHLRYAVEMNDRMGALPWSVLARRDLARLLRRKGARSREPERLIERARAEACSIGMNEWLPHFTAEAP